MFSDDKDSLNPSPTLRIAVTSAFVLFTSVALTTLSRVCRATRSLVLEHVRLLDGGTSQSQECRTAGFYTQTVAQTTFQASKANAIYYGAKAVEVMSLSYAISITYLYLSSHECDTLDERHLFPLASRNLEAIVERKSGYVVELLPFEMSYSLGAHQSFLLSLFFLASTYPNCCASVGGAILGSAWRLTLAVCSIVHALQGNDERHIASFIFTAVEGALMIPILFVAISLFADIYYKDYKQLSFNGDENINSEIDSPESTDEENSSPASCCFQCPSLWQISVSPLYSKEKRKGATILWISSLCLLVEMTFECVAMLKESIWDWNGTHHILKWGMHIVSQYLFVCIMAVSSPQVYRRARFLLFFACPAGTGIAIWQIFTVLISDKEWYQDLGKTFILLLFVGRALCGLGQSIGLILLCDSEVDASRKDCGSPKTFQDDVAVRTVVLSRANSSLWYVYMPSLVAYIVGLTFMGNGGLPMIPPTTFSCGDTANTFIFAQNWPGMGVFFHFGLLLVIFANDGIGDSMPSYKPSMLVAILFSGHVAFLLAIQLLIGVYLREDSLGVNDWVRISLLVPWMVASLHLCVSLQKLWKHRVLPE